MPFHTTRWSLVAAARSADADASPRALAELCEAYWPPLYAWLRRDGHSEEDSLDLVQGFLARLLEKGDLAPDRERGRFRSYLLGALKNFVSNVDRAERTLRRGGAHERVALDTAVVEQQCADDAALAPDASFERRWALTVIDRALERLRLEYESRGRGALFESLRPLLTGHGDAPEAGELAERLGLSSSALKVTLHRLRRRMGELVRAEIADTLREGEDVEAELATLFAALAARPGAPAEESEESR